MQRTRDSGLGGTGGRLVFVANSHNVRTVLAGVMESPSIAVLSAEVRASAELVLAEVLNNITEHAYAAAPGEVELTLHHEPEGLCCEVMDSGRPMPDGRLPEGKLPEVKGPSVADQPEGGFGWHLIHSLACDLAYSRESGRNRLTFRIPVHDQK